MHIHAETGELPYNDILEYVRKSLGDGSESTLNEILDSLLGAAEDINQDEKNTVVFTLIKGVLSSPSSDRIYESVNKAINAKIHYLEIKEISIDRKQTEDRSTTCIDAVIDHVDYKNIVKAVNDKSLMNHMPVDFLAKLATTGFIWNTFIKRKIEKAIISNLRDRLAINLEWIDLSVIQT